jgi:Tol biopolymer transport system component
MAVTSGTKLGPYEIISLLGAGGMGEVYRARDTRLDRTVAIKVLPSHLSSSSELKARFEQEARAISSLNHPHICHLYDVGSQDGIAYLVMEYLQGDTLADRLRRGALPLRQAMEFGSQIAEALATAHRAGILHRDLKPGNVMLTATGAKLMDFGLAKSAPAIGKEAVSGLTPSLSTLTLTSLSSPVKALTEHGTVVGTFQYMAPELLQGAEADARSDIFSLGCVLYEMVTGRRAFDGKSELSVLTAILESDPDPVSRTQPTSPPALDHVIQTCLEKNPDERCQTAHDAKLQLRWIAGIATKGIPAPVRGPLRLIWLAAAMAVLVALAFGAAYAIFKPHPASVVRSSILPPPGTSFLSMVIGTFPPALSPDGTRLAFTARDEQGKVLLYVRTLSSLTAQPLSGTDGARFPFWSPDGREIGFFADAKLKKIDAGGGPPQTLCDGNGFGGAWSKGGVIVFEPSSHDGLLRVSAAGGAPEPASKLNAAQSENTHRWPYFLPDGKHFLFWSRSSQGVEANALYVGTLGSLDVKLLMKGQSMAEYASGYLLFLRDQTLMARRLDLRNLEVTGDATVVAERVAVNDATNRAMFSASDSGTLLYQTGDMSGKWSLQWFGRDGKQSGSLAQPDNYLWPLLSADGKRLAVVIFSGAQGTGDIWILDLAAGIRTRLTFGPGLQSIPTWSPDGKTIFYASNRKGPYHIYAKPADGSGPERAILETSNMSESPEDISPDGRFLVYGQRSLSPQQTSEELWILPLSGDGKPSPVVRTTFNAQAAVSPDGKWLAYDSSESGRKEVYVTAFPGGGPKWQVSTNSGFGARWRRDSKELFFLEQGGNLMAVDASTSGGSFRFGSPHFLFHINANQNGPFDPSADGKKFLVNGTDQKAGSEPATLVLNWPAEIRN